MKSELYNLLHEAFLNFFEKYPEFSISSMDVFEVSLQVLKNMEDNGEVKRL